MEKIEKVKKQTKTFIYILEQLPRYDKSEQASFGKMLKNQIELLHEKYKREYDHELLVKF